MLEEQRIEQTWQELYSSKRRGKILHSEIKGIEPIDDKGKNIYCAILDYFGIRIIVPISELVEENNKKIADNMVGTKISFIVMGIEKNSKKAGASRLKALEKTRAINLKKCTEGDKTYCSVVGVWRKYIRLEVVGVDFLIKADKLQYGFVEDLTKLYKVNDQIKVVIKEISREENKITKIGIKELLEDPYKNIRTEFTEKGVYSARITGYCETGGLYANIKQGVDTICTIPNSCNKPPIPGDKITLRILRIIPEKRRILSLFIRVIEGE